ncbi:MAG: hypothetical protein LBP85_00525 [Prevotellaceae bacterium]|jgi:hypothetical protein|nr:hypothetical protein [Prevotellaceae bacterium]
MKKLICYAIFILASVLCISCEDEAIKPGNSLPINLGAEVSPVVSTQYSNEEIAEMVKQFNISHDRNVIPPAELQQKFKADFPNAYDIEWEFGADIY